MEALTAAMFAERAGEAFRLVVDGTTALDVELVEAREVPWAYAGTEGRVPFSVYFRGPVEPVLPQRIYRLEHAALGELDLFLVPVTRDASGVTYEAVFN